MDVKELFSVKGKKVIVTGAGMGIGRVMAISLAEAGADVSILEVNMEAANKVVEEIKKLKHKVQAFECDVTKKASVQAAYAAAVKAMGGLDVSLNVAGVCVHQPAEDITEKNWDFVIDVNMKGILFCTQEAGKYMIPQKSGSIINIASMSGTAVNVPQKQAPYNASKAGVMQLSKSFAVEWAKTGVRVNTISPGYTRTEMTDKMAAMFAEWEANTPMGRMCTPDELVGAMLYLASKASSYTTGSDIIVDGGYTAR
jgi:NAD(P)-dependent dehydrogenase (short-subunit alcohol dehydrogenase family)